MKNKAFISTFIIYIIFSCSSWKTMLKETGNKNSARMNVIIDFTHTYSSKKASYLIDDYNETENFYIFIVSKFKPAPRLSDTIGSYTNTFPTSSYEIDDNLFFWYNKNKAIDIDMINIMRKYNAIDSTFIKNRNGYILISNKKENASKNVFYFVCKEKISNYKHIKAIWVKEDNYPNDKACRASSSSSPKSKLK